MYRSSNDIILYLRVMARHATQQNVVGESKNMKHVNILNITIFGALQFHSWGRQAWAPTEFFVGSLILNNFYLKHLFI